MQIYNNNLVFNYFCLFKFAKRPASPIAPETLQKTMKYVKLTREQFEELHEEFALFLAAQSIDVKEWNAIKTEKPDLAEKEMEVFSDFVWERVLGKAVYVDHFSKDSMNLFKCDEKEMQRIVVKVNKKGIDLLQTDDFNWFLDNSNDQSIEYLKGKKAYDTERNLEVFELIRKGGVVSDGKLFEGISRMIGS